MWLSEKLTSLLELNVDETKRLREELSAVRAERDILKTQLSVTQNSFEWVRARVNTLEMEKAALLAKAFNVRIPAPEIVRTERDLGGLKLEDLFAGPPISDYDDTPEIA